MTTLPMKSPLSEVVERLGVLLEGIHAIDHRPHPVLRDEIEHAAVVGLRADGVNAARLRGFDQEAPYDDTSPR